MSEADSVSTFYALGFERDRFASGSGALELVRAQTLIQRFLPPAPSEVADVGGGPGRCAVWLAEPGHRVHLVAPVPLHIEQAEAAEPTLLGVSAHLLGVAKRIKAVQARSGSGQVGSTSRDR